MSGAGRSVPPSPASYSLIAEQAVDHIRAVWPRDGQEPHSVAVSIPPAAAELMARLTVVTSPARLGTATAPATQVAWIALGLVDVLREIVTVLWHLEQHAAHAAGPGPDGEWHRGAVRSLSLGRDGLGPVITTTADAVTALAEPRQIPAHRPPRGEHGA